VVTSCVAASIGLFVIQKDASRIRSFTVLGWARESALLALVDQESAVSGFVASRNPIFLDMYSRGRSRFAKALEAEDRERSNQDDANVKRIAAAQVVQSALADEVVLIRTGHEAQAIQGLVKGEVAFKRFRAADAALKARLDGQHAAARAALDGALKWAQIGIIILIGFSLMLAGYAAALIRESAGIEREATRDPLTQLANRRAFLRYLRQVVSNSKSAGELQCGVIAIDLDNFKPINDRFGHKMGDVLLFEIGRRLRAAVRHPDIVARLGGDEFGIAFQLKDKTTADALVARVRDVFSDPFVLGERAVVNISCSIGLTIPPKGTLIGEILDSADERMYREKEQHRQAATGHIFSEGSFRDERTVRRTAGPRNS
jgi:diguanylate cyclase (GGDEF)-like protein